jgi:hypothetical protein
MKVPFDYDLYDIALRRIVQLENILYQNSPDKRWRHILESDFAVRTTCVLELHFCLFTL